MPKYKVITDKSNSFFTNNKITVGTAAPTTGTHKAGDIVYSSSPNATAFGWICTASGTPGTWKVLKSGADVTSIAWSGVSGKPATYTPTLGTTSTTAFRGDYGNVAYNHSKQAHAPSNAQRNADITKAEIEAKLTGNISTHNHISTPIIDSRRDVIPPSGYSVGIETHFKYRNTVDNPHGDGDFTSIATIKPWTDNSSFGATTTQFSFGSIGEYTPHVSVRTAPNNGDSWGKWARLLTDADIGINVSKPDVGDYGYGVHGKAMGMIGVFQGWDKDCLFINTCNNNNAESPSFSRVRIKGHQTNIEGETIIQQGLNVWGWTRMSEVHGEVMYKQNPDAQFVDPWENTLCAIKVHGHIAATDVIKCRNFACSWTELDGKQLFMQWNDPGWGNEGSIWIRT